MKKNKKYGILLIILIMSLSLAACSSKKIEPKEETVPTEAAVVVPETPKEEEEVPVEPIGDDNMSLPPDIFAYDLTGKNWGTEGVTVKYPLFVDTNNQDKADILNDLIMNDMSEVIDGIVANAEKESKLTIDALYETTALGNSILTIQYWGSYFTETGLYPTNFYHTLTLDLEKAERIALKDLFVIDEAFVETFKIGMYAPYMDDLDLEAAGVVLTDQINENYTNEQLIQWFSEDKTAFTLADQGVIVSVPVPHVLGDHVEMAMNYEWLESNIIKEHPYWTDYLYLENNGAEEYSAAGFLWSNYLNEKYVYALSFPAIYDEMIEADAGDGVTMKSADGKYSLKIWASYNIDESTAATLLADAKTRYAYISEEKQGDNTYSLTFEGGGDGDPIEFVEKCYVTPTSMVFYQISYPKEEKDNFTDINDRMEAELYIE